MAMILGGGAAVLGVCAVIYYWMGTQLQQCTTNSECPPGSECYSGICRTMP